VLEMELMAHRGETVTRLWKELSGSLHRWFERRTGDSHAADDLLQECFLRVHDRIGDVEDVERLAAWIQGIAKNLLVDWRRKLRPESTDVDSSGEARQEPALEEEHAGVDGIVAGWLAPTIDELSESDQQTLVMTELQGVSQRDAAERLGISVPALKSRVLRGRERLRDRVLACCELEFDRRGGIVAYRERSSNCCDT
jgi:RNA polymerase sigma-70 factor (ECF subfamily)